MQQICEQILKETTATTISTHKLAKHNKELIFNMTRTFPENISLSKRIRAIAENNECKCSYCGKIHGDVAKQGYCSNKCYLDSRKLNSITDDEFPVYNAIRLGNRKFANKVEGYDYMICKICGAKTGELGTHIRMHNISIDTYKNTYNLRTLKTQKQIDSMKGDKNPGYNHGGRLSPFSEKYMYAETNDRLAVIKKAADNRGYTARLDYWLNKTDNDIDKSKELLFKRQQTFSLAKCIKKHGDIVGLKIWKARQEKWLSSYNDKSPLEMEKINKKKSNQMSFHLLWKNESYLAGSFYLLDLHNGFYKIGSTSHSVNKRYKHIHFPYSIILEKNLSVNHCFKLEQILKKELMTYSINKDEQIDGFGWSETFKNVDISTVITRIEQMASDENKATSLFKTLYNLTYEKNF